MRRERGGEERRDTRKWRRREARDEDVEEKTGERRRHGGEEKRETRA